VRIFKSLFKESYFKFDVWKKQKNNNKRSRYTHQTLTSCIEK